MAHGLADILAYQARSGPPGRRTEAAHTTGVAECGNCDTLLQGGNRGPVPCAGKTGAQPALRRQSPAHSRSGVIAEQWRRRALLSS